LRSAAAIAFCRCSTLALTPSARRKRISVMPKKPKMVHPLADGQRMARRGRVLAGIDPLRREEVACEMIDRVGNEIAIDDIRFGIPFAPLRYRRWVTSSVGAASTIGWCTRFAVLQRSSLDDGQGSLRSRRRSSTSGSTRSAWSPPIRHMGPTSSTPSVVNRSSKVEALL
jgi:hypothetical protein